MTADDRLRAVRAEQTAREAAVRLASDAIGEAFGRTKPRQTASNGLPSRKRGEFGEGVMIWAAKEKSKEAIAAMTEATMRASSDKGIFVAEAEAKAFAEQAYILAAVSSPYEDVRQEAVAEAVAIRTKTVAGTVNGN